jgi:spermidine/putrescine transport system ATP-binding protein
MLAGLERPSEGDIRLDGTSLVDVPTHKRDTPMVWQSLALFPFLNARENVEFGLKMRGVAAAERRRRAIDWLTRLDLAEFIERNVDTLSGGQRQRVALARALVTEPRILLLDEPLSALDASLKVRMQALMSKLQRDLGITFVYVTHSHAEAFSMADRVVIMSRGKIEQIGTPVEVYRKPATRFVAEFVGASNIIDGTVRAADATSLSVETKLGEFRLAKPASGSSPEVGSSIAFVLPEDDVRLATPSDPPSLNRLKGRVVGEEFLGAHVRLYLELADGHELRVLVGHGRNFTRSETELHCVWSSEAAFVLPVGPSA